jgi:hypothetical protein
MDRQALRATVRDGRIQPVDGRCEVPVTTATWRLAGHAWLVRAAAVTFLVGGVVASYLLFSTV